MFHPDGPTFFELARQALSSTQRGYDLLASKFDVTPFRTPNWMLETVANQIAPLAPFDSAIDLCCGTGAAMEMLQPMCAGRIVGVDFSQGMIEVAKKNLRGPRNQTTTEFQCMDVLNMTFNEEFDIAVSFSAFGHILPCDEGTFVQRIHDALKPGGIFVFATNTMPKKTSRAYWMSRGFNLAMQLRNGIVRPPFIMYYLTFLWPKVQDLLVDSGFQVKAIANPKIDPSGGSFVTVIAKK